MNDDCDSGNCSRPIKPSQAMRGYKYITGKMLVDADIIKKATEEGNQEAIAEFRSMYGTDN